MGTRVERRLAAVLAADVAGYSRLMGADEIGTLQTLKAHRRELLDPAIASNKGRIVKTSHGDAAPRERRFRSCTRSCSFYFGPFGVSKTHVSPGGRQTFSDDGGSSFISCGGARCLSSFGFDQKPNSF